MNKILFLDFDGVLHPSHFREGTEFSRVNYLEKFVSNYSVSIVISSSWRFHYSMLELKKRLGKTLSDVVIGTTGEAKQTKYARFDEITEWLEFHETCDWRALDDSKFEFPVGCDNLILCDGHIGISTAQLDDISKWLQI